MSDLPLKADIHQRIKHVCVTLKRANQPDGMITQVRHSCGAGMRWNEALGRSCDPPAAMSAAERIVPKVPIGPEGAHVSYVSIFSGVSTFAISRLSVLTLKYRILR